MKAPREFWDAKILQWEQEKYSPVLGLRARLDPNRSVKTRLDVAARILKSTVQGKTVVELGCGSALLAERVIAWGAASYSGFDISAAAIESAQKRIGKSEVAEKVTLTRASIEEIGEQKSGVVFSLGLLDWLSPDVIQSMSSQLVGECVFHSFSEKLFSVSQLLHRAYVFGKYGYADARYVPQYYSRQEILRMLGDSCPEAHFYRDPAMSFGCFVSNFSIQQAMSNARSKDLL
jgi:2-polyprenyl-3-methyl-5-hydroxy-6-metoxy-1,4-benzoquinol methylase